MERDETAMNNVLHTEMNARANAATEIQAVIYPTVSLPHAKSPSDSYWIQGHDVTSAQGGARASVAEDAEKSLELRIAEETGKSFEAGRRRGLQEGTEKEREAQKDASNLQEKQNIERLAMVVQKFDTECEQYLHAVEREVVDLALAIAARILRREAQMDPLLLTGAVRVALGQLAESTEVRLRVPANELELWDEAIAHIPNLTVKPKLLLDEAMRSGDLIIETEVGSVDLSIESQLGEIERGFFDRSSYSDPETTRRREGRSAGIRG
jgi:flagellar assembly protein FliH